MVGFNKIVLAGNLTRDIELRHTQSGLAYARFGFATNRKSKTKNGEDREEVCFVDCVAWGRQAEVLDEYVKKGSPLLVEGRLSFQQWEDRESGQKRSKHEVTIESFQFLGGRDDGGGGQRRARRDEGGSRAGGGQARDEQTEGEPDYGDIPF